MKINFYFFLKGGLIRNQVVQTAQSLPNPMPNVTVNTRPNRWPIGGMFYVYFLNNNTVNFL